MYILLNVFEAEVNFDCENTMNSAPQQRNGSVPGFMGLLPNIARTPIAKAIWRTMTINEINRNNKKH